MKTLITASAALPLLVGHAPAQTTTPAAEAPPGSAKPMDLPPAAGGPSKSARFRLQVGHISLGLTCPDDEPLKACADFAMQLLDKAEAMQKQ